MEVSFIVLWDILRSVACLSTKSPGQEEEEDQSRQDSTSNSTGNPNSSNLTGGYLRA
jgi:hypothetical protein